MMPVVTIEPRVSAIVVDVVAWALLHVGTSLLAHTRSADRLARDGWLLRERTFEAGGRWYRRHLRVDRWKDHLPDARSRFPGGTSKGHLPSQDLAGLRAFALETRRAELAHWWAIGSGVVFLLFNQPWVAGLLMAFGVLANLPFVVVQRHNRQRTSRLLALRAAGAPADRTRQR